MLKECLIYILLEIVFLKVFFRFMEPSDIKYLCSKSNANSLNELQPNSSYTLNSSLIRNEKPNRPPRSAELSQKSAARNSLYQHQKSFSSSAYDSRSSTNGALQSNNINNKNIINNSNFSNSDLHEIVGAITNGYHFGKPTVQVNNQLIHFNKISYVINF